MANCEMKIFSGNSNRRLALSICEYLRCELGKAEVKTFSDGEIFIEINESVRGHHAFVIQSTSAPANHNLMELLIMIDALKRASGVPQSLHQPSKISYCITLSLM